VKKGRRESSGRDRRQSQRHIVEEWGGRMEGGREEREGEVKREWGGEKVQSA
jgi:hypothetical protein